MLLQNTAANCSEWQQQCCKKTAMQLKKLLQIVVNGNCIAVKKLQYCSSQQYRLQHHAVNDSSTAVKILAS